MPDLPAPQLMVGRLSGRPQLAKLRWGRFFALRNHDRKGVQRANEGSGAVEAGDRMAKTDSTLDEIIREVCGRCCHQIVQNGRDLRNRCLQLAFASRLSGQYCGAVKRYFG